MLLRGKSVRSWCDGSLDRSVMVDQLSYNSAPANRSGQCSTAGVTKAEVCVILPFCWMMHIKEQLLLIGKSSSCGGKRFSLSLFKWSSTIRLTPYNRK